MAQVGVLRPRGIRLEYVLLWLLCGRTMLAADRATADRAAFGGTGAASSAGSADAASPEPGAEVLDFQTRPHARTDVEVAAAFDAHGNAILRLAYSYLHNTADAEDILQETLVRYMQKAPVFDSRTHEKAWLLRVASNLSKNHIEYNKVRDADELMEELMAEERQDLSFVWEAVRSLPVPQREAIHLFYQEGYSTAEVAQVLGQNESTVRSHLRRGREKLRQILREAYDFE